MIKKEDLKVDFRASERLRPFESVEFGFSEIVAECKFNFRTCFNTGVPIRFVTGGEKLTLKTEIEESKEIKIAKEIVKKMMWKYVYADLLPDILELRMMSISSFPNYNLLNAKFEELLTKINLIIE